MPCPCRNLDTCWKPWIRFPWPSKDGWWLLIYTREKHNGFQPPNHQISFGRKTTEIRLLESCSTATTWCPRHASCGFVAGGVQRVWRRQAGGTGGGMCSVYHGGIIIRVCWCGRWWDHLWVCSMKMKLIGFQPSFWDVPRLTKYGLQSAYHLRYLVSFYGLVL